MAPRVAGTREWQSLDHLKQINVNGRCGRHSLFPSCALSKGSVPRIHALQPTTSQSHVPGVLSSVRPSQAIGRVPSA